MSRMTYRWTLEDWKRSYEERYGNLWFLNIINFVVLVGTLLLPAHVENGVDARCFLPALMVCINFVLCYTFLDDIAEGMFAGIACGVIFGVLMVGLIICADAHVSAIVPPALAVVTSILFFWGAANHYKRQLAELKTTQRLPERSRRRGGR